MTDQTQSNTLKNQIEEDRVRMQESHWLRDWVKSRSVFDRGSGDLVDLS